MKHQSLWAVFLIFAAVMMAQAEGYVISTYGTCCSWSDDGNSGSGDGSPANSVQLCAAGLATNLAGNLFIADSCGHRVRKVGGDGNINTVAGNWQPVPIPCDR